MLLLWLTRMGTAELCGGYVLLSLMRWMSWPINERGCCCHTFE